MLGVMVPSIPSLGQQVTGVRVSEAKLRSQFCIIDKIPSDRLPRQLFFSFRSFNEVKSIPDHTLHPQESR
jgi:hypothetical protein